MEPPEPPVWREQNIQPEGIAGALPEPLPLRLRTSTGRTVWRGFAQYFFGIGIGSIPLAIFILALAPSPLSLYTSFFAQQSGVNGVGCIAWGGAFVLAIGMLASRHTRFIAYGILSVVLATPVIAVISCFVLLGQPTAG
ncbi:MAG: hypothetical protein ABI068_07130 [Ktedonobacterales bacterium]